MTGLGGREVERASGARPIRVAVFEPRPLVAEGIAALLTDTPGVDVVGATAHRDEAARMIEEAGVDVLVFGSENHRHREQVRALAEEFTAAAQARGQPVGLVCVIPGGRADADDLSSTELPTVVTTGVSLQGLRDAIQTAYRGADGAIPLHAIRHRITRSIDPPSDRTARLTSRETDVLRDLVQGLSTKEIALRLGISVNTVRTHVQHLMPKLGVHSRLQAAAVAAVDGLILETSDRGDKPDEPRT